EAIEAALRPHTRLVSVMAVNNEVGTVQPLTAIGGLARAHGALFHCDAAQAAGRIALDVQRDGIDLLSLSAHKLYGPKGVGALYVRRRTPLAAQLTGGGQEGALRPGTLNVPGIVGLGEAARLAAEGMADETARQGALRDDLLRRLEAGLGPVALHGCRTHRVAGNLSLTIPGVKGGDLLAALPEIAMSAGSACMSAKGGAASPVLRAINVPEAQAAASLRIGLGRFTTEAEVVVAAERIVAAALRLRRRGRAKSCRA
ncbi:MAG: aminotransferase class V-fold PLP-dependent enzyme, partial [Myxococcota bacterium]